MAIVSSAELNQQSQLSYLRGTYYVMLLNDTAGFDASATYASILSKEVPLGTGGYQRLSFNYSQSDIAAYSSGQPLSQKIANFVHNNSSQVITFTHVALVRKVGDDYTVVGIESVGEIATLSSGKTATININILHGRV